MKTNKEFADECVKVVATIIGLLRPQTHAEFTQATDVAARLIEASVEAHMAEHFDTAAKAAQSATEKKP
jgi:hypothetical protein